MISQLLTIRNATFKFRDQVIFENLNFNWKSGQHYAVLGNSGVEQSAFLDTLLGKTISVKGEIHRPFAEDYKGEMARKGQVNSYRDLMAVVSQKYIFKNKSNLQNFYYQQRFNSMESEEAATVGEFLVEQEKTYAGFQKESFWNLKRVIPLMQLEDLKNKSLIKLSNGETRRLAIAAALIKNPKLLLMDQPMTGLDMETRRRFGDILKEIVASGIHIIMTTNKNEIPECISHIIFLEKGKIFQHKSWDKEDSAILDSWGWDEDLLKRLTERKQVPTIQKIVAMNNVTVRYDQKLILDKVNWTVLPGQKWALKGPNGAGKSTLLSLIQGENPQAYANDIILFDRKRGTGESIWDIKRHIGFVAPELVRYFPNNQTCLKVVLSGLFDTIGLFKKVSADQEELATKWLSLFKLEDIANHRLHQISLDQQRFVLLARAMIKNPDLLILDEAAQGMDEQERIVFKNTVDRICNSYPIALIYVSHYEEDIPDSVEHYIRLENGKVVGKDPIGIR